MNILLTYLLIGIIISIVAVILVIDDNKKKGKKLTIFDYATFISIILIWPIFIGVVLFYKQKRRNKI